MKTHLLPFVFLLSISINSQTDIALGPTKSDTSLILHKMAELENYINNSDSYQDNKMSDLLDQAYLLQINNSEVISYNEKEVEERVSIYILSNGINSL